MKKFALLLASAMLVMSAAGALAAAVPSKTTTDVTQVKAVEVVNADGTVVAEPSWNIVVTDDDAPVAEEITKIYDQIAVKGQAAVSYFPAETQEQIAALLPETVKATSLTMNEFISLQIAGNMETAADAKVTFTFTTKYSADQHVVVVIGIYDGSRDANGQYVVTWIPLEAEVQENGDIVVVFPAEVVAQINDAVATAMAVLND